MFYKEVKGRLKTGFRRPFGVVGKGSGFRKTACVHTTTRQTEFSACMIYRYRCAERYICGRYADYSLQTVALVGSIKKFYISVRFLSSLR